jgi:hypothetical protein
MMSEARLHTLRTLAQRLKRYGLSAAWLKAEAEAGRIPSLKAGRRLLFDADAVEAALIRRAASEAKGGAHVHE